MKCPPLAIYLLKKLLKMLLTVLLVTSIIFFLVRLMPSNPIDRYVEDQMVQYGITYAEAQNRAAALFSMDLNKPVFEQYLEYIGKVFQLDFGNSLLSPGVPVMDIIAARLPWTLFTVGMGLILSFAAGIVIGAGMAFKRERWYEPLVTGFASFLSAIPDFLIAICLLLIFGVVRWNGKSTLIPIGMMRGTYSMQVEPGWNMEFIADVLRHGMIPILTYMLSQVGVWVLLMKTCTTSCLNTDYVTMLSRF